MLIIIQETIGFMKHILVGGAHQLYCACLHSLRTLGGITQHQNGLAQRRSLLLNTAAIGENNIHLGHQIGKGLVIHRLDEVNTT